MQKIIDSEYYKKQINLYPKLSQEEICFLYESDGITSENVEEIISKTLKLINDKKNELSSLTGTAEERLLNSIFGENSPEKEKIKKIKRIIYDLEETIGKLTNIHEEMKSLITNSESKGKTIKETIEKLSQEIEIKKQEVKLEEEKIFENETKKHERINELRREINILEVNVERIKLNYNAITHKLYVYTRGLFTRDRVYPSKELRNKIVCGTLYIAYYWAKVYFYKADNTVPFEDLYQIACQSLMSAAYYYIPSEKAKFTTYARKCIENKLKHEVYSRNKMKKRKTKSEYFFQMERDRIKYIKMFLESMKIRYGSEFKQNMQTILCRFRENIRYHNREVKNREELYRLLPSFKGKVDKEKIDYILNNIYLMIKGSKIKTLISEDDKELASLLANYKGIPDNMLELFQLIYFLDTYLYKIDLIENYLIAEQDLITQNDGIAPTDEEILEELNRKIKLENQERYRLRKENFYRCMPSYKRYFNYYTEYKEEYEVDPFISSDEYEVVDGCRTFSSKQKEYDDIVEYIEDLLHNLTNMIESIDYSESEKVVLYFSDDNLEIYNDWIEFDEYQSIDNGEVLTKEEALDKLRVIVNTISSLKEDDIVKTILKQRKDNINAILKEKNAPLIEQNREIAKLREKYLLGSKFQRHIKMNQISETKRNVELLFGDDNELLILLSEKKGSWYYSRSLSVEDEALNNIFLEDYYKALSELSELEQEVLLQYYDECGLHSMTAREIGSNLGITTNKVYKVKAKALEKIRQNPIMQSYNEE